MTNPNRKKTMEIVVVKTGHEEISHFRKQFLNENHFQFIYNKCHDYGWADTYLFVVDGLKVGFGAVWGTNRRQDRDSIFEFYIIPPFRKFTHLIFPQFLAQTNTIYIESQSNDFLLTAMLYEYAANIRAEAILFEDYYKSELEVSGVLFRKVSENDQMKGDDSEFILEQNGEIVASGGLMLNYNFPYADIYMQVKEPFRRKGLGSFLVQELKAEAYRIGRVPAARCNINNKISKATLLKAGLQVCGFRLKGDIRKGEDTN